MSGPYRYLDDFRVSFDAAIFPSVDNGITSVERVAKPFIFPEGLGMVKDFVSMSLQVSSPTLGA